jgi:hypothetical protein
MAKTSNLQLLLDSAIESARRTTSPVRPDIDFFEYLSATQLLKTYDLSQDEIETGIMGGGNDGGIDGFYVMVDDDPLESTQERLSRDAEVTVVVFQSKATQSFSGTALDKLISTMSTAFDLSRPVSELRKLYREDLIERVEAFRKFYQANVAYISRLRVQVSYVSRAEGLRHAALEAQIRTLTETCQRLFPGAEVTVDLIGARELLELIRQPRSEWLELKVSEGPLVAGQTGFVCLVRLYDYAAFVSDERGYRRRVMFLDNVRDYEGARGVNHAIAETLRAGHGEDFWTLNNGVTLLADEVRTAYKTLALRNPKVVNGLQTTLEIFNHARTEASSTAWLKDERTLLVRVVVPQSDISRDRIIVATNSQTPIAQGVLKATDAIHRDIEDAFRHSGLFYERRRNSHRNDGANPELIVTMPTLAAAVTAIFLRRPHMAVRINYPKRALTVPSLYSIIFSNDYPLEMYVNCAGILLSVQHRIKGFPITDDEYDIYQGKNRRGRLWWTQWHIAMSIAMRAAKTVDATAPILASLKADHWESISFGDVAQDVMNVIGEVHTDIRRTHYQAAKTELATARIIEANAQWLRTAGELGAPTSDSLR